MDGGTWQATVDGVAEESATQLTTNTHSLLLCLLTFQMMPLYCGLEKVT